MGRPGLLRPDTVEARGGPGRRGHCQLLLLWSSSGQGSSPNTDSGRPLGRKSPPSCPFPGPGGERLVPGEGLCVTWQEGAAEPSDGNRRQASGPLGSVWVCVHACLCTHTRPRMCVHACLHTCVHVCAPTRVFTQRMTSSRALHPYGFSHYFLTV